MRPGIFLVSLMVGWLLPRYLPTAAVGLSHHCPPNGPLAKKYIAKSAAGGLLIVLLACLSLAQSKPTVVVDKNGIKTTTTERDTPDGHVTETVTTGPTATISKTTTTITTQGTTTQSEIYDLIDKKKVWKDTTVKDNQGNILSTSKETYNDGVLESGQMYETDVNGIKTIKKYNPVTGTYEVTDQYDPNKYTAPKTNPFDYEKLGYRITETPYNGVDTHTFTTPNGKIDVNLPNIIAGGDAITGSMDVFPSGGNKEEIGRNNLEIAKKMKLRLPDGSIVKVGDNEPIFFEIPASDSTQLCDLTLLNDGEEVATDFLPAPPGRYLESWRRNEFWLPTGGQTGRYLRIDGPFDGRDEKDDSVRIGDREMRVIAESPRAKVVLGMAPQVGLSEIFLNEHGFKRSCPFRSISIKLTADNLRLLRGETTTLHVEVTGLFGLEAGAKENEPARLPLTLENKTPSVISMEGGVFQTITIDASKVGTDGTFKVNRQLTGIVPGSFNIVGTVTWNDTCH